MSKNKIQKLISVMLMLALAAQWIPCGAANIVPINGGNVAVPPSSSPFTKTSTDFKNPDGGFSLQTMKPQIDEIINPQKSKAEPRETYSGTCGDKVNWNFQPSTGKLTVSGFGEMFSYANTESTPWSSLKSSITSVEIKEGITNIGANAFCNCNNLKTVTIPDSVINIEKNAFASCDELSSVTFGKNVRNVGDGSFYNCAKLKSCSLPDSLISIERSAFNGCKSLEFVHLGNSLKTIEEHAFHYCESLTSIIIPNSVTYIGNWAFMSCSNLKTVVLGSNVISFLGEAAFSLDQNLVSFTYLGSYNPSGGRDNDFQFNNCIKLSSVIVPNNYDYEGKSFYGKSVIKSANLLSWSCGDNIGCILDTSSNTLTVSGSGKMYDYGSSDQFPWYSYKSTIKTLVIEEGVTSISEGAFKGFSEITSVAIPNSVKYIGKSAFEQCNKLSSVTLGDNVNTIGQNAFYNCNLLNVLNIPKSVSSIEDAAFSGCNNIHSVTYLGSSDPGKTSSNVFSSPYLSYVDVPSNYDSNRFCGKSVRKDQPPVSDSSSSKHPKTTNSSDICNCDKSEDYFAENKSWIIPLIVTAVIDTLGVAAAVVGVVYKIFCR